MRRSSRCRGSRKKYFPNYEFDMSNCRQCGNSFNGSNKYCGPTCVASAHSVFMTGSGNPQFGKAHKVKTNCEVCAKPMLVFPNWFKRGQGRFCSRVCLGQHHSSVATGNQKFGHNQEGQNNGMYGKKHSSETKEKLSLMFRSPYGHFKNKIRSNFKYRQWKSDILTRDEFACVLCGDDCSPLEVDHYPESFSSILIKYEITSLDQALDCEKLWDINNGRVLCRPCHFKTDTHGFRGYWLMKNQKEQLLGKK